MGKETVPNKVWQFADLLSMTEQMQLINDGSEVLLSPNSKYGKVIIKSGTGYYVIIVNTTITYRIHKKTLTVYNFYKKPVGSIEQMIQKERDRMTYLKKKEYYNIEPMVSVFQKPSVASQGWVGKIFYNSWGYDQTNIDFVQVVSETAKQVKVTRIAENRNYDPQVMSGKATSAPFILIKGKSRGELILIGKDKSGRGSSQSTWWNEYEGRALGFSDYA